MTPTQICNLALDALPAGNIVSLDESSLQGKTCAKHYPQVLAELLEAAPWRWARTRILLNALLVNDRENQWAYAYSLPANTAFPIQVLDSMNVLPQTYEFTGVNLYTNTPDAYVEYVSAADLSARHPALFRAALIATLAARISMPITKDMKKTDWLASKAEVALQRAQAQSHNQTGTNYFDHVPDIVKERVGINFDDRVLPGPETNYPVEDFVTVINNTLDY